eukprot:TRINITY_DN13858_c0_g1_i1.p1 TRINITY_DN13858_c0_g1~~TRINITY_DN13858_c0_g1_i1.p1  ORF type:complete len:261 (+),score=67.98 TRINITY_DN13858_c0_g1_i1:160-942(+)
MAQKCMNCFRRGGVWATLLALLCLALLQRRCSSFPLPSLARLPGHATGHVDVRWRQQLQMTINAPPGETLVRKTQQSATSVVIRKAEWEDLGAASKLLVREFYGQSVWYPTQCLGELNRLQMNFHFDRTRHLMLVACDPLENSIVGFVDIDARELPPARMSEFPPRPYLSDLAVSRDRRRQGIGTRLVSECERVCQAWGHAQLYLKVQAKNGAGVGLYQRLGYQQQLPADEKDQLLLRKALSPSRLLFEAARAAAAASSQ